MREKEKARAGDVVLFEQRRKTKVGKLSQVNLQVLRWKLAICSLCSKAPGASLVISATLTPEWIDHVT